MVNHQLHPLETNPRTGEPFLRVKYRKDLIITPPRRDDVALYTPIMNDPRIYKWLRSPPFPYTKEHAEEWYATIKQSSEAILAKLEAARESPEPLIVQSPVRSIRQVKEDGEDVYVGDIDIFRCVEGKLLATPDSPVDDEHTAKYVEENAALALGDPNIIWTLGYYVVPSFHGKGIMTDVVRSLLWEWAVPRMGVRSIVATAFEGNEGSIKVFQKNGFVKTKLIENNIELRGEWRNTQVVEWHRSTSEPPFPSSS